MSDILQLTAQPSKHIYEAETDGDKELKRTSRFKKVQENYLTSLLEKEGITPEDPKMLTTNEELVQWTYCYYKVVKIIDQSDITKIKSYKDIAETTNKNNPNSNHASFYIERVVQWNYLYDNAIENQTKLKNPTLENLETIKKILQDIFINIAEKITNINSVIKSYNAIQDQEMIIKMFPDMEKQITRSLNIKMLNEIIEYYTNIQVREQLVDQKIEQIKSANNGSNKVSYIQSKIDKLKKLLPLSMQAISKLTLEELNTYRDDIDSHKSKYILAHERKHEEENITRGSQSGDSHGLRAKTRQHVLNEEAKKYETKMDEIRTQIDEAIKGKTSEIKYAYKYLKYKAKYLKSRDSVY